MIFLYLAVLVIALYWVSKLLLPEMRKPAPGVSLWSKGPDKRTELLETLLIEKNKSIRVLQTEIKALEAQVRAFDKVRSVLDEEILRLREQNRIFRSELGLPTIQSKESSIK